MKQHMIHKVCDQGDDAFDPKDTHPCWNDKGECSRRFPYEWHPETTCPENCFAQTRRRKPEDGGQRIKWTKKNGETCYIDNRYVVRYSPRLLLKYNCHLNVEVSGNVESVKYICKYFTKGHDMSCFLEIMESYVGDEIQQYKHGRFIGPYEAHWDLCSLPKFHCDPSVKRLALHLPNMQSIMHEDWRSMNPDQVEHFKRTTLTSFFELNADEAVISRSAIDPRDVPYQDFPKHFTWNYTDRAFNIRKRGMQIGRIWTCSFRDTERWYLRKLMLRGTGFTSFEACRTVPKSEDVNFLFADNDLDGNNAAMASDGDFEHKMDSESDSEFEQNMDLDLDIDLDRNLNLQIEEEDDLEIESNYNQAAGDLGPLSPIEEERKSHEEFGGDNVSSGSTVDCTQDLGSNLQSLSLDELEEYTYEPHVGDSGSHGNQTLCT